MNVEVGHLADVVVGTALTLGIPAVVATLWRLGNKVAELGASFTALKQRVDALESQRPERRTSRGGGV